MAELPAEADGFGIVVACVGNEGEDKKIEQGKGGCQDNELAYLGEPVRSGELFFEVIIGEDADFFLALEEKKAQENKDQARHKERTQNHVDDKTEIGVFHNSYDVEDCRNQQDRKGNGG